MENVCSICLENLTCAPTPLDVVNAMTSEEKPLAQPLIWRCEKCLDQFHVKCLRKWFKTQKYTNIACPACKRSLSLREASDILNVTAFDAYVTTKLIENYNSFIKANSNIIHRYIAIKECIDRYKDIALLRKVHARIEEIITEYKQYKAWREFDSEAQSMTEEVEEKLDEFDERCSLFTITTKPITNVEVNVEIFKQIISSLTNNIFILLTNITLPIQAIKLVRSYIKDLEANEIYRNSLVFSINELELMSINKSPYTLLTKLKEIQKNISRTIVCPCTICGGCVIKEMERCELCFARYCLRCLQPWTDDHVCDENVVGDVEYLLANTRPCPNCGVRIAKTKDCNHMFCTHCFITYNWESGEIITQSVQNPYRDEWIKKHGGDTASLIDAIEVRDKDSDTNRRLAIERISLYIDAQSSQQSTVAISSLGALLAFVINGEEATSHLVERLERKILTRTITLDKSRRKPIQRQYYAAVKGRAMLVDMNTMLIEILKAAAIENSEFNHVINLCLHTIASFANRFLVITEIVLNSFTIRALLDGEKKLYHLIWSFVIRGLERENDLSDKEINALKRVFAFQSTLTDIVIM